MTHEHAQDAVDGKLQPRVIGIQLFSLRADISHQEGGRHFPERPGLRRQHGQHLVRSTGLSGEGLLMLLDGGVWQGPSLLREEAVAELVRPIDRMRFDRTSLLLNWWSAGLMLGERWPNFLGRDNPWAFGHLGLVSCLNWADPARDIAVTIRTTGKRYLPFGMRAQFATAFAINSICAPLAFSSKE